VNAHTAKLISRFASRANQKRRVIKREWNTLSAKEKAARRVKMKAGIE